MSIKSGSTVINSNKFALACRDLLGEWSAEVWHATNICVTETADWAVEQLHNAGDFGGGKYRKSWTQKTVTSVASSLATVYTKKPYYRISHLLEFGHAKKGGGRTTAYNFIAPINDRLPEEFDKRFRQMLGRV